LILMNIQSLVQPIAEVEADWLVLGLFEGDAGPPPLLGDTPLGGLVGQLLARKDASAGVGDTTPVFGVSALKARAVLLVGLGPRSAFGAGAAFDAGVAIGRRLGGQPRETVAVALPDAGKREDVARALTGGVVVGTRGPGLRKAEVSRHAFGSLRVVVGTG